MDKMRAFVRINRDTQDIKRIEVNIPSIDEHEVLVKVRAFGVGLHDRFFIPQDAVFPYPIGSEGSGEIIKIGEKVTRFKVNDYVILTSSMQPKGGCWAEYVAVSENNIVVLPDKMDVTTGGSLPVAGKTALEIMQEIDLKKGDTLFIAGASGAIGTLLIQLAKLKGIRVAASASSKNHDYMKSLGREYTVDYNDSNWKKNLNHWQKMVSIRQLQSYLEQLKIVVMLYVTAVKS